MHDNDRITRALVGHFFRRFFDNDTIQVDGDTLTTVVRAISAVAVPGLMVAFFLQTEYPQRPAWGAIEDQYFFVLISFVVMGVVSIFEWEMLFPDRLDFLILSPLSLKPLQMLAAKAAALIGFFALFLVGCNLFGTLLLPAVSKGDFVRHVYAHGVAVVLAGVFAASLFLAIGGVLLCVLDAARFRIVSPIMQAFSVMALVLLMLQYLQYGDSMQILLSQPHGIARWMPPIWFLGLYQHLLHGNAAQPFAQQTTRYAIRATAIAAIVALLTYPIAWARMRRMAMEGSSRKRRQPSRWLGQVVHAMIRHRRQHSPGALHPRPACDDASAAVLGRRGVADGLCVSAQSAGGVDLSRDRCQRRRVCGSGAQMGALVRGRCDVLHRSRIARRPMGCASPAGPGRVRPVPFRSADRRVLLPPPKRAV